MTNTTRLVRGIAATIAVVVAVLAVFGLAWYWASDDGQSASDAPSSTSQVACDDPSGDTCFQDITVMKPVAYSGPSTCEGADVTAVFTSESSETLQIDGLTFNRNAERAVIDVPATIKITTIIVGDVAADVQGSILGRYKTSYFLPYYSWGKVGVVTVCLD